MIGIVTKEMFFSAKAVMDRVTPAVRRVLSKFGAFVRTGARSSIRRRKAISAPGSPPSSHVGHLRRLIYFGYDATQQSVVIGPTPFHGPAEAPPLLEYGGSTQHRTAKGGRILRYRARPFMGPAFEREKPKLAAMWRDSVKP